MSGIGLVLSVAKDALLTNQYALDVVSHNIANVNTEGYTKQVAVLGAQQAAPYAGFVFGRGVKLEEIIRNTNSFLEQRLQTGNSAYQYLSEKNTYMNIMESIFNESSSRSLSNQLTEFWDSWNDLANNPSGIAERNLVTEYGSLLSGTFNDIAKDLDTLEDEIENTIETGVDTINGILAQIADLNEEILVVEVDGNANDLIDERQGLVNKLAKLIDINTYEYEDGNLAVSTGRGYLLVSRNSYYQLDYDGTDIIWENSAGSSISISDTIRTGQMGGWLDIRDEVIPKYKADLNELAKSTIWELNSIHSQGVGLEGFTSVTGTYSTTDKTEEMGTVDSGLSFYDKITDGSFKIWTYDATGAVLTETTLPVSAGSTSMQDLADDIDAITGLKSSVTNGKLHVEIDTATTAQSFTFSDDSSNILAALGINTFFDNSDARDMTVNDNILSNKNYISAALVNNNVGPAVSADTNTSTGIITTSGPYTGSGDATYNIKITAGGPADGTAKLQWNKDGGSWSADVDIIAGNTVALSDGVTITFTAGNYANGDTFTIDAEESSNSYGDYASGDNSNVIAIADLQFQDVTIKQWEYERGSSAVSRDVSGTTIDNYLHLLVSTVGILSQSVKRELDYKETLVEEIKETRDNISSVSIDEEMSNLIRYQHAYSAAAKLITTAEEMLETLLNIR